MCQATFAIQTWAPKVVCRLAGLFVAAIVLLPSGVCRASERNTGNLLFHNNYNDVTVKVILYDSESPDEVWKGTSWDFPPRDRSDLAIDDKPISVRGDWRIRIEFSDGSGSSKHRINSVGAHCSDGKWHVYASNVEKGQPPKVRLPISASRGSARWTIDAQGVVTSHIRYTVSLDSESKIYTSGLIVEFADGTVYTASATKTVDRPSFGIPTRTDTNQSHNALSERKLNDIRRVYAKYSNDASGPKTIREWINEVRNWAREGAEIYKELKDNELVQDAVKIYAGT